MVTDDTELALRAAQGCVDSFAALAARHQVAIVHYAASMLGRGGRSRCDADDVAQQTFLRAQVEIATYRAGGPFAAWLFAIARRTCINHLRGERRRAVRQAAVWRGAVDLASGPLEVAAAADDRRTLPEPQFTAMWLHYVEGLPVASVATVLERSPAAVKLLLLRGRRRLAPVVFDLAPASFKLSSGGGSTYGV
jgi:RNA polymerase sigma-70 factor, ECF subfamily